MRRRLINLTRLGDLLQTQPVLHALKTRGDETGLVCLENFADAALLLRDADHVAALPGSALLASLGQDWKRSLALLTGWMEKEQAGFAAEATLNLTPTLSARLLSRLFQPEGQPEGFSLDAEGFGRNGSPWGVYAQAVSACRGCSPFNLVDTFRHMAGVTDIPPRYELRDPAPEILEAVGRDLAEAAGRPGAGERPDLVAFQLGASNDARRWPETSFATVGRKLLRTAGVTPVLVGSAEERPLAHRYQEAGGPGIDLTGRTDLPRLAAVLRSCRLLITNDTGTMHLAAGLGVPVLALFLATAQPWDTGPYRENCCCLEPRLDCHPCGFGTVCPRNGRCRAAISPSTVAGLALAWLENGAWPALAATEKDARVWLTVRDENGFLDLRSLSGDETTDRTAWIRIQRRFYRHFLDELSSPSPSAGPAKSAGTIFPLPAGLTPERRSRIRDTLDAADGLLLLAGEQGRLLADRPLPRAGRSFLATCDRISSLLESSPDFVPLSLLWRSMIQEYAEDRENLFGFFGALRRHLAGLRRSID